MSIVICFPHTSASQFIGYQALANQYNIFMYMPSSIDLEWGDPILWDLKIQAARSGENIVEKIDSPDFSDPSIKLVFFPSLGEFMIL